MSRILLVDDQADIRKLVRLTLEFEAHEISEAGDGEAALALAAGVRPDLVLLDVMMPGALDGFEVCRRIKADPLLAGTRVVLLTARAQPEDLAAAARCGADLYLAKPFSPLQLLQAVGRMCGGAD